MIIGLQPIIENTPHNSLGPSLKHVNLTKKPKLVVHLIVMIQKVPIINQPYEPFENLAKAKEEFHKQALKEANGLVVVPWPQPQPTKHLSAPRLFTCWIVDFCLMMYLVVTWLGSKEEV